VDDHDDDEDGVPDDAGCEGANDLVDNAIQLVLYTANQC
jgi:hypothetical protein